MPQMASTDRTWDEDDRDLYKKFLIVQDSHMPEVEA